MKIKVMIALLLLIVMSGLQLFCCQHAVKIEKLIDERKLCIVSEKNLIH